MAYRSFTPWPADDSIAIQAIRPVATAAEVIGFTAVELRVIALAERSDATTELSHDSRFGRILERVFGIKLHRPLANPRLESLRRFASLVRHHPEDLDEGDVHRLVSAGFTAGQADGLRAYFSTVQQGHA